MADSVATIYSMDISETVSFEVNDHPGQLAQWAKYPFGVIKEMHKAGLFPKGFNAVFGGDITSGEGLSSSAALESVFAVALNTLFDLVLTNFVRLISVKWQNTIMQGSNVALWTSFHPTLAKKTMRCGWIEGAWSLNISLCIPAIFN